MGLLQDLTKLNQQMAYCESKLERIRAKEFQGIELAENDIKTRIECKELLKAYREEWDRLIS